MWKVEPWELTEGWVIRRRGLETLYIGAISPDALLFDNREDAQRIVDILEELRMNRSVHYWSVH